MKKAVGYIRVSTTKQKDDGVSLAAQRSKLNGWAMFSDHEFIDTFNDDGISGKDINHRPGLIKALELCYETGATLVSYSISRISRSTKDMITIGEQLQKHSCELVSLTESIDTTTASGKMMFKMFAILAELERDQASERTTAALQHLKKQGKRVGNIVYGYMLAPDATDKDKRLIQCPDEQQVIEHAKSLKERGRTLRAIQNDLEAAGYKNRRGNPKFRLNSISKMIGE